MSLSHDVANDGHDRDDRGGVSVFPIEISTTNEADIGVFDLRAREAVGYELRVRYF